KLTWFFQANSRPAYATPAVYEAMAYALVSRYKDHNKVWEIENEPNFGYTPENYVNQCVVPFAKGAKRADPNCIIMGPGCVSLSHTLRFMDTIYSMGASKWLDNISTHTYPGPGESWEQFGNLSMLKELRSMLQAHGDGNKPLWQTEQGYAWDNAPRSQSARYAVRQFLQGWRNGIEPAHQYYFYPHSHGFESWYQAGGGEQGSGEAWMPIAAAQRFLAENTQGMKYVGDVPSPYKGVYLARFSGATEDVIAAWTMDFPLALSARAESLLRVVDAMANPISVAKLAMRRQQKPTLLPLSLSGEPIYIHVAKGSAFTVTDNFGRNLASAEAGATASASSDTPGSPASFANDGNWELWENDVIGLKGRTAWKSGQKDPSPQNPDTLQITFPVPRTINRMVALCYLPAVNPSPRDWEFQAQVNGKWQTLAAAKNDWAWAIERSFAPVTTSRIRMVITRINDGWHGDRRWMHILMGPKATNYTESKVMVSELEAYGPPTAATLTASITVPKQTAAFKSDTVKVQVVNGAAAPLQGNVQIKVPTGWTVQPARLPVTIGARQKVITANIQLNAPAEIPTGNVPIDLLLTDRAGKAIDATRLNIEVAAPIEITPQNPTALNPNEQPLSVAIKNVTDKPLSGTVALSTTMPGIMAPPAQAFGPLAPKASATVTFQVPHLNLVGTPAHFTYTAKTNGLIATGEQSFALRGWQVLGPYPNPGGNGGFDTVYEPEHEIDFNKTYKVQGDQAAHWKPALDQPNGFVDLMPLFQPNSNVVAYATVYEKSPTARKAILSTGSDDGIKAWLNGKVVLSNNTTRGASPGSDLTPVELKAGWNQVLLKITQGGYGWGFYCDFLDAKQQPMTDLVYATKPQNQ
ncbi:MAG: discoidin domain-containing protein, partial [Abitibacteriaceae bacterium]|nr:discoidin domain-containing protein [Abditibacteriaceae bacterium]